MIGTQGHQPLLMLYNIQKNLGSDRRAEYDFFYCSNPTRKCIINWNKCSHRTTSGKDSVQILISSVLSITVRGKLPDKKIKDKRWKLKLYDMWHCAIRFKNGSHVLAPRALVTCRNWQDCITANIASNLCSSLGTCVHPLGPVFIPWDLCSSLGTCVHPLGPVFIPWDETNVGWQDLKMAATVSHVCVEGNVTGKILRWRPLSATCVV